MGNKKIVFCGGGSAGHVMPNLALIENLKNKFSEIHYIGGSGIEKQILANYPNIIYHQISCEKLRRSLSLKNLLMPFYVLKGYFQSKKLLKQIKPGVVFSKGGFVSVPVVYAAAKLKIPVLSHESDLTLGLANKLIYRKSKIMFTTFKETALGRNKCIPAGAIIRNEIFNGNKNKIFSKYTLDRNKKTILVVGGSLGAKAINDCIEKCVPTLTKTYNVIHLTGKGKLNNTKAPNYVQVEYTNNIQDFFAAADIVITRAGSGTIFELLALNKKMLLIPLSKKASRGDQILNAKNFERNGYAKCLLEENLTPNSLLLALDKLTADKSPLSSRQTSEGAKSKVNFDFYHRTPFDLPKASGKREDLLERNSNSLVPPFQQWKGGTHHQKGLTSLRGENLMVKNPNTIVANEIIINKILSSIK